MQPFHVILMNPFNLPLSALLTRASNPLLPLLFILSSTYFIYLYLLFVILIVCLLSLVSFSLIFTLPLSFFLSLCKILALVSLSNIPVCFPGSKSTVTGNKIQLYLHVLCLCLCSPLKIQLCQSRTQFYNSVCAALSQHLAHGRLSKHSCLELFELNWLC